MDIPNEEAVEIPNSEETPVETPVETPSDEPPVDPPVDPVVVEDPPVDPPVDPPADELFELPDGRKVDAATLQTEWKENFAPEYTRKSQELADLKKGTLPIETPPEDNPYADPDYVPQNYEEILQVAEARALATLDQRETDRVTQQTAAEDAVVAQLEEVKKDDPNIDENKLFLHANKYGFRDLKTAHQNMKDMGQITKTVQKQTAENIAKRKDPVSVQPGAPVGSQSDPSAFGSAIDYMRSLKS